MFEDDSTIAKHDWTSNTGVNGVIFSPDTDRIKVDLSTDTGIVHIPLQLSWKHSVQFEFSVRDTNIPLRLYRYELSAELESDIDGF